MAPAGTVMIVEFTLAGIEFVALNGGPMYKFTEAFSLSVQCEDQSEIDFLWDKLLANGGSPQLPAPTACSLESRSGHRSCW